MSKIIGWKYIGTIDKVKMFEPIVESIIPPLSNFTLSSQASYYPSKVNLIYIEDHRAKPHINEDLKTEENGKGNTSTS